MNPRNIKINKKGNRDNLFKNSTISIVIIILASLLFFKILPSNVFQNPVSLNQFLSDAKACKISRIDVSDTQMTGTLKSTGEQEYTNINSSVDPTSLLKNYGINLSGNSCLSVYVAGPAPDLSSLITIIATIAIVIVLFMLFRQMRSSGGGIFSMGETRAKLFMGKKQDITFNSVAGVNEAKAELEEVVEFLKNPKKFTSLGARIPKGVLLVGAPGTGKTLMARAVAGEAGVPFFSAAGTEFEEMLVGAGASRMRDLFDKARKASPSIIFIDEIDAIGRRRGTVLNSGHTEQTLNQLLIEMDGFEVSTNIIVLAATNRPDILDPALLRPGRFDRTVTLDLPDLEGRKQIIQVHSKNKPLGQDVDIEKLAKRMAGFSGADIENTLNEASIIAAKKNLSFITEKDLEDAALKVVLGPEKKRLQSKKEKEMIAYHEAGHALVSKFLPESDPVHKISIISRGLSLGSTMYLPEQENVLYTKTKLTTTITHAVAGRVAEKLVFNDITSGASDDIERATDLAKKMVTQLGMSDKLGFVQYGKRDDLQYLNYSNVEKDYSDETAAQIDNEISKIMAAAIERATKILTEHRDKLDAIAKKLLEQEVIEGSEFDAMLAS